MSYLLSTLSLSVLLLSSAGLHAQNQTIVSFDAEGGMAFSGYNRIRIPGNSGTLFNTFRELRQDPKFYYRLRPTVTVGRHAFSALFAPLELRYTGNLKQATDFNGQTFNADEAVKVRYRFNSYRLTYRYNFLNNDRIVAGVGITAKARDAFIDVSNASVHTRKSNFGFVPLINIYANGWITDHWGLLLEGDALATNKGRAEDIFLGATYRPFQNLTFKGGYRILEGGADNDEVYNFTLVNYVGLGVIVSL